MLIRSITLSGLALLFLFAGVAGLSRAEAGPPDHYADLVVGTPALTDGCVAQVSWSGLNGGKPLFIQVRLVSDGGNGVTVANTFNKVKQNDNYLEVDLSGFAAAGSYELNVTFQDRQGNHIRPTQSVQGSCS